MNAAPATAPITIDEIANGDWWEATWPRCWRAQTLWLDADQWVVLGQEGRDSAARMTHQVRFGDAHKIIVTRAELCEYLNRLPWKRIDNIDSPDHFRQLYEAAAQVCRNIRDITEDADMPPDVLALEEELKKLG